MLDVMTGGRVIAGMLRGTAERVRHLRHQPGRVARAVRGGAEADRAGLDRAAAVRLAGPPLRVPQHLDLAAPGPAAAPADLHVRVEPGVRASSRRGTGSSSGSRSRRCRWPAKAARYYREQAAEAGWEPTPDDVLYRLAGARRRHRRAGDRRSGDRRARSRITRLSTSTRRWRRPIAESGYHGRDAANQQGRVGRRSLKERIELGSCWSGSPDTVVEQIRRSATSSARASWISASIPVGRDKALEGDRAVRDEGAARPCATCRRLTRACHPSAAKDLTDPACSLHHHDDDRADHRIDGRASWPEQTHHVRIDRSKTLAEEPGTGHNRWHEAIPPVVTVAPGDRVILETRDALDGQITPRSTVEDRGAGRPDAGPPADRPGLRGGRRGRATCWRSGSRRSARSRSASPPRSPGFGFLRDVFTEPHLVRWQIADGWATSDDLPGVAHPRRAVHGRDRRGAVGRAARSARPPARPRSPAGAAPRWPPDPSGAVPTDPAIASTALRTIPPRETGGNLDVKQLTGGTTLLIPVYAPGALFSVGDAHFAQGDGEACGTAVEMAGTFVGELHLRKGEAARRGHQERPVQPRGVRPRSALPGAAPLLRHDRPLGARRRHARSPRTPRWRPATRCWR